MDIEQKKQLVINRLMQKGFTKEQSEGFIAVLQDTDLTRQVNELTTALLAIVAADVVMEVLL